MKLVLSALALAAGLTSPLAAKTDNFSQNRQLVTADDYQVLSPRARIVPQNRILTERLQTLLPQLMAETDLDMWLVINREYAEDPVYFTLVPQPTFAARRTTMLLFSRKADGSIEKL